MPHRYYKPGEYNFTVEYLASKRLIIASDWWVSLEQLAWAWVLLLYFKFSFLADICEEIVYLNLLKTSGELQWDNEKRDEVFIVYYF